MTKKETGKILWLDLTIDDAAHIRDFYSNVVGWKFEPVKQVDYEDYNMISSDGNVVAGICHKRGGNKNLPSQWLTYISVENLESSIVQAIKLGGKIIEGPTKIGEQQFVVIQDPAGAYMALFQE